MDQQSPTRIRKIRPACMDRIHTTWTDEEIKTMIKRHNEGASMGLIAQELGKTRNAVAGQIHRARKMRLLTDKVPHSVRVPEERSKRCEPDRPTMKKRKRVRLRLIDSDTEVSFHDLKQHHCKWPMGDPRRSDFRFCGRNRLVNSPYCEAHSVTAGRKHDANAEEMHGDGH